jgi:filamentous hemagglutinin family protein
MVWKIACLTGLFVFSSLLLDPTWGQLVNQVDLVKPLPVPIQGDVTVTGNVNVVNTPGVVIQSMPNVTVSGDVNVANTPEVRIADVAKVEVVNDKARSIPVRVTNPSSTIARENPEYFFSWHSRSSLNNEAQKRRHRAVPLPKMAKRRFVLTDLVATTRFRNDATELRLRINGSAPDRSLGLDFIVTPWSPLLVSHFQTGIVFQPDKAIDISVVGDGAGGEFQVDYAITFSGYFVPTS